MMDSRPDVALISKTEIRMFYTIIIGSVLLPTRNIGQKLIGGKIVES